MVSQVVKIKNATGLHLQAAGVFCQTAMRYKSKITFKLRGDESNAKSVLSVRGACVKCGDEIVFRCTGPDESEALEAVVSLAENGFGEEE